MNETLQFEQHPDADQISAFVEQALPGHEREAVLRHLSVCAECRAVVALSLPEVAESGQPVRAVAKPWWLGWTLVVPFAGALAAGVLTFVYLRPATIRPVAREPEVAVARPTPEPPKTELPSPEAAPRASHELKTTPETRQAARADAITEMPPASAGALTPGQAIGGPITTGGAVGQLSMQAAPPAALGRNSLFAAKAPVPSSPVTAAAGASKAEPRSNTFLIQRQEQAANQNAVAASPRMQSGPAANQNAVETVNVARDSAALETEPADSARMGIALNELQTVAVRKRLPSHLAVLSSAVLGERVVAVDAAHNVFASNDGGQHWKAVPLPWQGHAVQASLVQQGVASGAGIINGLVAGAAPAAGGDSVHGNGPKAAHAAPPPAPIAIASVSGTVTDRTGAVIPGATVTATEIATGIAKTARADAAGHYAITGLASGTYRIEGVSAGFKKQELASVAVGPGGAAMANLTLDVGASAQTVTVEANSALASTVEKKQEAPRAQAKALAIFEIVTDSGERWTSVDGLHWNHN